MSRSKRERRISPNASRCAKSGSRSRPKPGVATLRFPDESEPDDREEVKRLLENIRAHRSSLEKLLEACSDHWGYEDPIYRFYHQSWKVYGLQEQTAKIVEQLQGLRPTAPLNEWFLQIVKEGTGKKFTLEDNRKWLVVTRPILEAFFHARYFLEMAVRYGKELKFAPRLLPSGWAALLYLYDLR